VDLRDYAARLLARFRNRALRHRTAQIAADGSQKLPQRLLEPLRAARSAGRPAPHLVLAVAGWMRHVVGVDERGAPVELRDPLLPRLREAAAPGPTDPRATASRLLGVREVFGDDLPQDPGFREAVAAALEDLVRRGSRACVAALGS
jgi:fructuronate reductase